MRKCIYCKQLKPMNEFRVRTGKNHRMSYCHACDLIKCRERYWRKRETGWKKKPGKNPYKPSEKSHARALVQSALRYGKMERQLCIICGLKAQAHHEDYSKPYEVEWLCSKHHAERHRKALTPSPRRRMDHGCDRNNKFNN